MIDFDFELFQPTSVKEATSLYGTEEKNKHNVMYISGATEFISRARMQEINPEVVIDLKDIPECHMYEEKEGNLIIGSAITLSEIVDDPKFPLLAEVCQSIATRTERNKITIGGNICSHLPYKEAVLPFLLADSEVMIATGNGTTETRSIHDLYKMKSGEFLVQIVIDISMTKSPYQKVKKTKQSKVNYPIVTIAALFLDNDFRLAVSGLCKTPFREWEMEKQLNDKALTEKEKVEAVMNHIPAPVLHDMHATKGFRCFLFETILSGLLKEEEQIS